MRAFGIAAALLLSAAVARAQDLPIGRGVVCDTPEQVARFAALFDGDPDDAITRVNSESDEPNACGVVSVMFEPIGLVRYTRTRSGLIAIMEIEVVAMVRDDKLLPLWEPMRWFAVAMTGDKEA